MARVRQYIDTDVLTEAKKRIRHVIDTFDTLVVMFSGGKDSLVVLNLLHEVYREEGLVRKVEAVFRDEELIPDEVIDFVDAYRRKDWLDLKWFCYPLHSVKYILGVCHEYVQWDPSRAHVREMPPWGLRSDRVFDQYTMDGHVAAMYRGKVAFLTGVRAAESLIRYRACVNKLNENYITGAASPTGVKTAAQVQLVKPIFDWEENDVFRYLYERDIPYCPVYDAQLWAGENLRVSTPLHAEAAKHLDRLAKHAPKLWDGITRVFPEVLVQARYWKEIDTAAFVREHARDFSTIKLWIMGNIEDDDQRALALKRLASIQSRAALAPEDYPPEYVFKAFLSGAYKREIMAIGRHGRGK